jgi:molecular chaperone HscB
VDLTSNYFNIFHLPTTYEVDTRLLKERYLALQKKFHPDRYASASKYEQRIAVQSASSVNNAFEVLLSPVKRAQYLLELAGKEQHNDATTISDTDFLMAQMDLRQQIAEIRHGDDPLTKLDVLEQQVKVEFADIEGEFSSAYTLNDLDSASAILMKMQFYAKLLIELQDMEASFEENL